MKSLCFHFAFLWVLGCLLLVTAEPAQACPFCEPVQNTLGQDMELSDAVVLAELVHAPPVPATGEKLEKSKFRVTDVLKGESQIKQGETVEILFFDEGQKGDAFLLLGVLQTESKPRKLSWVSPTPLDTRALAYVKKLPELPADGPDRLDFFEPYLEDENQLLSRDAYDEFARAPYDAVIGLKDRMNHQQLITWIQDPEIPASRRRLYFTMLGVCGNQEDSDLIEGMLKSSDRQQKSGLDAMIACYLRLRKSDGLPLVEELFLKNKKSEYADTYSAIMALRFHGQETDVIPREKILKSMHCMLDRPELADLVIVDLARWEDWSVMERLVTLFKKADEKSSWVRVPVVRYLLVCPKPEAKQHLVDLEKIDAGAVRRAKTFFPVGGSEETSGLDPTLLPPGEEAYGYAAKIPIRTVSSSAPAAEDQRPSAELSQQIAQSRLTQSAPGQRFARSLMIAGVAIGGSFVAIMILFTIFAWRNKNRPLDAQQS